MVFYLLVWFGEQFQFYKMEKEIEKMIPVAQIKENLKVGIISLILGILSVLLITLLTG